MTAQTKRAITVLLLGQFLVFVGIGLIIPVMPFIKQDLHLTATDMGIMTALFAAVQFIASPIVGRVSDKTGRRALIAAGLLLFAVSEFIFAMGENLTVLNIARAIGGLSAALAVPTTMALAADMTTQKQRARVIGWLSAALSGGLVLGPGIGGVLAEIDHKMPFWIAGIMGLVSFLAFMILMPKEKDLVIVDGKDEATLTAKTPKDFWTTALIMLLVMIFVSSFGLQGFESTFSIFVHEVGGFTLLDIAWLLIINGIVSSIFQIALFDMLVRWMGEIRVIRYSFLMAMAAVVWVLLAQTKWEIFVATLIIFTGFDLIRPAITTLLSRVSAGRQGLINGLNMSLTSVGNIVGPVVAGALLDIHTSYPYTIVAIILFIATLLTYGIRFKTRYQPEVG